MDSKETHSSGCFSKSASVVVVADDEPISLVSSATSRSYGAGESYMHHNKGTMMNTSSPQPPAMSLRARESSSMALKQIFDQINNGGRELHDYCKSAATQGQGFQGPRNQSMPDLRKRVPELDLSFRKAQDRNSPYAQTAGFGSPISTPAATNQSQAPPPSWSGPMTGQLMQHNYPLHASSSSSPGPSSRQPTAQMTIFYSGNVNVYDDVPADKAHAIMLLAGNSWSSPAASTLVPRPAEMTTMKDSAPSLVKASPSQQAPVSINNTNGGGIARSFGSPAPPATSVAAASLASHPPSPAPVPLSDIKVSQAGGAAKRPHTGIELPHARKASLARFLEKRKDRVQVQQVDPDQQAGAIAEENGGGAEKGGSESCSGKPDCPSTTADSKKQRVRTRSRSCSPSPLRSIGNVSNSAASMIHEDAHKKAIINEHRFFQ